MQKNRLSPSAYIQGILEGDRLTLSRAITLIESTLPSDALLAGEVVEACIPYAGNSYRIGITGPPGVGKSSFIDHLGTQLIEQGSKVAVLAIDPSSTKTKGSILGDKTRMSLLSHHPSAYVRPSPTGSTLGGVARKTREALILCEAAGFNYLIVETVGVGQSETAVNAMVDIFLLLLLPQAGDSLQGIKKGIMEMAHTIIIHKADGNLLLPAQKKRAEFTQVLQLLPNPAPDWKVPVICCSSLEKTGFGNIHEVLKRYESAMKQSQYWDTQRKQQSTQWMKESIFQLLESTFFDHPLIRDSYPVFQKEVESQQRSPIQAAKELFQLWQKDIST